MQTEQLKENVKGKVRDIEDGGMRLIKKGKMGLVRAIFSRFGLMLLLLLLQFGLLFLIFRWFGNLVPHYFGSSILLTVGMVLYLLNCDMDNSVKITWLVVIAVLPVVGVPLFFYIKSNVGHNLLQKRLLQLEGETRAHLPQENETFR